MNGDNEGRIKALIFVLALSLCISIFAGKARINELQEGEQIALQELCRLEPDFYMCERIEKNE